MKTNFFIETCDKYFCFLIDEFGFEKKFSKIRTFQDSVFYKNKTTGIEAGHEIREKYISVKMIRLINGEVPPYPIFPPRNGGLHWHDLENLLSIRNPSLILEPDPFGVPFTEEKIEVWLKQYAMALKEYASDVLRGDFAIFPELDKVVRKRAKGTEQKEKNSWGQVLKFSKKEFQKFLRSRGSNLEI